MRAIVGKHKQRPDLGKHCILRVRGRLMDFAEVVRYWHWKGVSVDDVISRRTASPTSEAVEFFYSCIISDHDAAGACDS